MNTRHYPRTLEEAFGPYQRRNRIEPMRDAPIHRTDRIVVWGCVAGILAYAALKFVGVIP